MVITFLMQTPNQQNVGPTNLPSGSLHRRSPSAFEPVTFWTCNRHGIILLGNSIIESIGFLPRSVTLCGPSCLPGTPLYILPYNSTSCKQKNPSWANFFPLQANNRGSIFNKPSTVTTHTRFLIRHSPQYLQTPHSLRSCKMIVKWLN
jgi:hypothetical protein